MSMRVHCTHPTSGLSLGALCGEEGVSWRELACMLRMSGGNSSGLIKACGTTVEIQASLNLTVITSICGSIYGWDISFCSSTKYRALQRVRINTSHPM